MNKRRRFKAKRRRRIGGARDRCARGQHREIPLVNGKGTICARCGEPLQCFGANEDGF